MRVAVSAALTTLLQVHKDIWSDDEGGGTHRHQLALSSSNSKKGGGSATKRTTATLSGWLSKQTM